MMIEYNELIDLIIDIVWLLLLLFVVKSRQISSYPLFLYGILFIFLSHILTVLESFILPEILNTIEHLSFTLAGVLFCVGLFTFIEPRKHDKRHSDH